MTYTISGSPNFYKISSVKTFVTYLNKIHANPYDKRFELPASDRWDSMPGVAGQMLNYVGAILAPKIDTNGDNYLSLKELNAPNVVKSMLELRDGYLDRDARNRQKEKERLAEMNRRSIPNSAFAIANGGYTTWPTYDTSNPPRDNAVRWQAPRFGPV